MENLKQSKYEYEQKIDSPKTWIKRDDINRPWLHENSLTFNEQNYQFDDEEQESIRYNYINTPVPSIS